MKRLCCLLSLLYASVLFADAPTYRMPTYTLGTLERRADNSMYATDKSTPVPSTATLAFRGLKLADLADGAWCLYGFACGGFVNPSFRGYPAGTMFFQEHRNGSVIDKAFGTCMFYENSAGGQFTKGLSVEYTEGPDGVYARLFSARYVNADKMKSPNFRFVTMNDDGTYKYYEIENTVATKWDGAGYGLVGLTASQCLPPSKWIPVWSNGSGEKTLTLDDIRDYTFHGFMTGGAFDLKGYRAEGYNKRLTTDAAGHVTRMTVEFQMIDGGWLKSVVVALENGEGGIVGQALGARYAEATAGLGFAFVNNDGTLAGSPSTVATSYTTSGYGVYELTATPPPPSVDLVLDRSKTWSELVAGVNTGTRDTVINVKVTADNPTLTFDAPVDRARVTFSSTREDPELTFAGTSFTIDRLEVGAGIALHTEPDLVPMVTDLAAGATLVYDPKEPVTLTGTVSGAGGVVLLSGDVTMSSSDSSYTGGTRVKAGATVRPGCSGTQQDANRFGPFGLVNSGNPVWLEKGATYDVNGMNGASCWIRGQGLNPIVNTGDPLNEIYQQAWGLILDGDMDLTVNEDKEFGFVTASYNYPGGITLGESTLFKRGPGKLSFAGNPLPITGSGTIEVCEGALQVMGVGDFTGKSAHLKIDEDGIFTNRTTASFATIENNGTIVMVPRVATNKLDCATYSGTGKVIVAAAQKNTAQVPFVAGLSSAGRRYEVRSGRLIPCGSPAFNKDYALNTVEEPTRNQRVDVLSGATFDLSGCQRITASVTIAGEGCDKKGALQNAGAAVTHEMAQLVQITLADDATIGGTAEFGLLAPGFGPTRLELGAHTLTLDTDKRFFLYGSTISGNGAINIRRGTFAFGNKATIDSGSDLSVCVSAAGVLDNAAMDLTLKDFENAGVVTSGAKKITVTGVVTGGGTDHPVPNLVLASGATVKVSDATKPLAATSFTASGTITLDLSGIEMGDYHSVPLIVAPKNSVVVNDVRYVGKNLPRNTCIAVRGGLPSLVKCGLTVTIR